MIESEEVKTKPVVKQLAQEVTNKLFTAHVSLLRAEVLINGGSDC